ncbi:hypothetical protein HFO39_34740 [Rhizobium leguminosarum]|uniref:hypothetical protein n=1 Tax=Rhizobium leguminosarum TaxID=384 RepID=UPI001C94285A|nr:hypothetical protein [Rhizobium leguminosarum]MBY5639841.1 hypothetical protein [Rhizobium leguminosarum]MBY5728341.1 hypothetical protein [Rhizobium leguminosarum]
MRSFLIVVSALTAAAIGLPAIGAKAEDASWGCQVLLCAASKNPSWHGVAYCVPPMTKLIAAMKEPGFSWPICHEANAGKPGRENYEDCPAGTTVGYSSQGDGGWRGEPDRCTKMVDVCHSPIERNANARQSGMTMGRSFGNGLDGCIQQIATPRPRRADPYFFDIPNDQGMKERFWFNLDH